MSPLPSHRCRSAAAESPPLRHTVAPAARSSALELGLIMSWALHAHLSPRACRCPAVPPAAFPPVPATRLCAQGAAWCLLPSTGVNQPQSCGPGTLSWERECHPHFSNKGMSVLVQFLPDKHSSLAVTLENTAQVKEPDEGRSPYLLVPLLV